MMTCTCALQNGLALSSRAAPKARALHAAARTNWCAALSVLVLRPTPCSRLTLAKIVRGIATGAVRRHCEERENLLTVSGPAAPGLASPCLAMPWLAGCCTFLFAAMPRLPLAVPSGAPACTPLPCAAVADHMPIASANAHARCDGGAVLARSRSRCAWRSWSTASLSWHRRRRPWGT